MEDNRPIVVITVKELRELIREVIAESAQVALPETPSEESDIIFIEKVSDLTGLSKFTIYSKVSDGKIPTIKRGKPLRFSKKAILEWLQNGQTAGNDELKGLFPNRKRRVC